MSNLLNSVKALLPKATPVASIPAVVTIKVVEVDGQTRRKFVGAIDEAASVQVNLYLPEGMEFPKDGFELEIGGDMFNASQTEERTRKGSVKVAWGDLRDSESFGAAVFAPPTAGITKVIAVL